MAGTYTNDGILQYWVQLPSGDTYQVEKPEEQVTTSQYMAELQKVEDKISGISEFPDFGIPTTEKIVKTVSGNIDKSVLIVGGFLLFATAILYFGTRK